MNRRTFLKGAAAASLLGLAHGSLPRIEAAQTPSGPILADEIKSTIDAVPNWNDNINTAWKGLANIGLIFGKSLPTDYDSWITDRVNNQDWLGVMHVRNFAYHSGYDSQTMTDATKLALSNMPMLAHGLPLTDANVEGTNWFYIFFKYALHGYRYSQELNWETSRWNAQNGFNYLAQVYDSFGRSFYGLNDNYPIGVYAESESYGTRWLEAGKMMGCFLTFHELGIDGAMEQALRCWNELNTVFWHTDHYTYSTGVNGLEFSAVDVYPESYKLSLLYPNLPNFGNLRTDLNSKYLSGWQKGQWSSNFVDRAITQHLSPESPSLPFNPQLRVDGTLNAWALLHMSYCVLDDTSRSKMTSLLEGTNDSRACDLVYSSSARQPSGQFILQDQVTNNYLLDGTAQAALCMFLNGISVVEGNGLAIPLISDWENDSSSINSYHFGFSYENKTIKVPVWSGTSLTFLFGDPNSRGQEVGGFDTDGVYFVHFSSDWNRVVSTKFMYPLNVNEKYLVPTNSETVSQFQVILGTTGSDAKIGTLSL